MTELIKIDSKGRLLLPKAFREKTEILEGSIVKAEVDGNRIIIEPSESIADKYYGRFKVDKMPDDIEDYIEGAILGKWLKKHTST